MATAIVSLIDAVTRDVIRGDSARSESVTTSGTAASGLLTAGAGQIAQIYCTTGVYARSGGTVTAATGTYCPPAIPTYVAMTEGSVVSLIDA